MTTKRIKGIANFEGKHYEPMGLFAFVVETENELIPVIATPKTHCDVVLSEDEYFFEIVEINGRNVVSTIEVFDYKNDFTKILEDCFDSTKDTDDAFEKHLNMIDRKIFSLEVKEKYEDFLLVYDTIEGKLQEGEDGLVIISNEDSTIKAIIDTTLMAVDERDFLDYKTANFFEGLFSPDGFYVRKCYSK